METPHEQRSTGAGEAPTFSGAYKLKGCDQIWGRVVFMSIVFSSPVGYKNVVLWRRLIKRPGSAPLKIEMVFGLNGRITSLSETLKYKTSNLIIFLV